MAEDDYDDRLLNKDALEEAGLDVEVHYVEDGVELIDYLHQRGLFKEDRVSPRPSFILLDLKMPRKNGWEALEDIKADPNFYGLPVFILTTSNNEDDQLHAQQLGANGYFTKPATFAGLVRVMRMIGNTWQALSQSN
jgi:two-component system response regulator